MSQAERFEILILGSGAGGNGLAWHMARTGRRTAVVERQYIGGSCPNINCLPSKNEIWGAKVMHLVRHAAQFGTNIEGSVTVNMAKVRQRKRDMVEAEIAARLKNYRASGAQLIMGSGRFVGPKTLEVGLNSGGTRTLVGDRVFINVGTRPAIPTVPGLQAARPLTNIDALDLDYAPAYLIVLGGGYVGLELAQAYRRFGSEVTVIEQGPQLMSCEDPDVSNELRRILTDEGIRVLVGAQALRVDGQSGRDVSLVLSTASGEHKIQGSDILVAAGRMPNTDGIGLKEAGVERSEHGYIQVNDRLETTAPGVWAIGECAGSPQFTHVSVDDFQVIRENLEGGKRSTKDRLVPFCLFTDPPLGRVGMTERDAQREGVTPRVARLPISVVSRAHTTDEREGFMKALVGDDDRILGFAMIGAEADGVMTVVQTAMLAKLPYSTLRDAILTHPTMAEGLRSLLAGVPPRLVPEVTPAAALTA
jgi:pyruvate/2-oxoglutarate dehydrogenase complex dihydrolipoamide dehydrogenase (E3) component